MISSVAESQQVAFQMALLASFLPTMMLSGFVFPIASMPRRFRRSPIIVPARYFLVALRAIVLKGAELRCSGPSWSRWRVYAAFMLTHGVEAADRQWT